MINFAHICPTNYLSDYSDYNGVHLILAHLVEEDQVYADFYLNLDDGKPKIMDNSAFEMYKQGRPMYPSEKLIEMGKRCGADYIVMTDYPDSPWEKTKNKAKDMIPLLKGEGFGTFYCPQSKIGDVEGLIKSIQWGLDNIHIDLIGLSILSAPNAFGVEKDNRLQRYLSRLEIFNILDKKRILDRVYTRSVYKRFHCLGMVDGPKEIKLLERYHDYIFSWDSSAAIWAGMNGITFDDSPTGLLNGKFEKEVDFNIKIMLSDQQKDNIINNINFINRFI